MQRKTKLREHVPPVSLPRVQGNLQTFDSELASTRTNKKKTIAKFISMINYAVAIIFIAMTWTQYNIFFNGEYGIIQIISTQNQTQEGMIQIISTQKQTQEIVFPIFNSSSIPPVGSMCPLNPNNKTNHARYVSYCKHVRCMKHRKDVDKKYLSLNSNVNEDGQAKGCKMLWFTAIHESEGLCDGSHHQYNIDYSVALHSAIGNAKDVLQPVLILGRYGLSNENSTEPKKLGKWAEARGVKVIYSPRLSFQEDVNNGLPSHLEKKFFSHLQGPFLRLDIPKFIKEHNLFDMPNVCQDHILYTDADVIFANNFTQRDAQLLKNVIGEGMVSFGREYAKKVEFVNTGVMVINVDRFEQELPQMLHMAKTSKSYPGHDQDMLNQYLQKNAKVRRKINILPMHYNWKSYWGLEPSKFSQVKIIHFHGPKLGQGLEEMKNCDVDAISNYFIPEYKDHLGQGACCDQGKTADWSLKAIKNLKAPIKDLCELEQ